MEEDEQEFLDGLLELNLEPSTKRPSCEKCRRPCTVCWCPFLPSPPVSIATTLHILQHPFEESRRLKTGPMLFYGVSPGKCHVYRGKRFGVKRFPALKQVLSDPHTILLYPGPHAQDLQDFVKENGVDQSGDRNNRPNYNLILLDGTWSQARGLYMQNPALHNLKQVQLSNTGVSEYVIRTQPTEGALSTLETAVIATATLEGRPEIIEPLLKPLRGLCAMQMEFGEVVHQSKEYLVDHGLYKKQENPNGITPKWHKQQRPEFQQQPADS